MTKKLPPHVSFENNRYRVRYKKSNKYPFEYDKYFSTKEEAIKANQEYIAKNTLNLLNENNTKDMLFADYCDYFMEWYINKPKRPSPNTVKGYLKDIRRLKKAFGKMTLPEITAYQIEMFFAKEKNRKKDSNGNTNEKISLNTLHHEYTMLRMLLNKAKEWKFISENPMDYVEEPYFEEKIIEVPEFEELKDIEAKIFEAPIRERCQFLLAFYTGMREEEVCGVHLEDIDIKEKNVKVNRAIVQDLDGSYTEDRTKSQSSIRTIPLPDSFFPVYNEYLIYRKNFVEYLKIQTKGNYEELKNVFLNKDGHYYRPNRLSRMWSKFSKQNNIKLTFHGLRHYYLTNQMNYNPDLSPRDVQELAGHSSINTTYKYVHPSKNRIQKNATNLFSKFKKEDLYTSEKEILNIPINHLATIILGKPIMTDTNELQITLSEITNEEVNLFNISSAMKTCKDYLLINYPSLSKIECYVNNDEQDVIDKVEKDYGNSYEIEKMCNYENQVEI